MCTGFEIAMMAASAVGTVGTIYSGIQQAEAADNQAQIAENNAAYEADANKQQAEKIRRMAKAQRCEANAALAKSGVKLGEGTALEVQKDITQKSEEDALSALLSGSRAIKSGDEQADMLLAKLVLILANQVGDRALLAEAIELARSNTLNSTDPQPR